MFRFLYSLAFVFISTPFTLAETLDDIVQHHESTLAQLNCYRVQVRSRPPHLPWGTEYDMAWLDERNGDAHKLTTIKPGIMTDAMGNNPVAGNMGSTLMGSEGTRSFRYRPEYDADIQQARKSGKRVMKGDRAYLSQDISAERRLVNTAMMHPNDDLSLPQLLAKSTQSSIQPEGDQWIIHCTAYELDYAITIDPHRKYMITRVETSHQKGGYKATAWVKQWTEINEFWLPTEIEKKSTQKVGNRVLAYSDWKVGPQATSLLELKFLTGSVVTSRTHFHIWGENDQPEISFPINDEAALHAYEQEVLRKYRKSFINSKSVRVSAILGVATVLLIGGYWIHRRKQTKHFQLTKLVTS